MAFIHATLDNIATRIRPGARCLLVLLCLCGSHYAQAQVWSLAVSETGDATATLDVGLLQRTAVGSVFQMQVDATAEYTIRLDGSAVLSGGDRSWFGSITNTGLDYALVITVGNKTAHLVLTSPSGIFQLFGTSSDGEVYQGNFHRLEHVRDEVASTEIILPPAGSDVITSDPFSIRQVVSQSSAPIGAKLTFDLTFTNNSFTGLAEQFVDIFFVLENTTLDQLPANCEILESTSMLPVLSCELGPFAARQAKTLSYSVTTSQESHPEVYSAVTVGNVRNDIVVNIYRDVTTDSDGDTISDYNESLLGTDPAVPDADRKAYIDVLVAYTPEIKGLYLGEVSTRINQLFNVANKIFADSGTGIVLRPVGIHEVNYSPATKLLDDLGKLTFQSEAVFSDIPRLRELYGGDLVVLFRTGELNGLCGLANLGGKGTEGDFSADYQRDFAFSVINIDCLDDSVLAHEVGHNLGLVHSRREDPDGGTLAFSAGYGVDTRFVSVMAFPDDFDVVNRLYRFSDPYRACGPFLCGEDKADSVNGADAVSSLKLVKHQVANYFPSQEDRITTLKAVSSKEGASSATLGVAAYSPDGTGFKTSFTTAETVNLRMKVKPLPLQVGRYFVPHIVVLSDKEHLYQVTGSGALVPWNGDLKSLIPAFAPRVLGERELFDVVKDIDLGSAGLLDRKVFAYVAYRLADTGELIYGATPFAFRVNTAQL